MGAFTKLFQRLRLTADANVTTQTTTVIQTDTTNSSIALAPNGTGAIIASVPDGTATGGNARGQYAVDFQTYRTNANQVASGIFNAILSGSRHRTLGEGSVIAGGDLNIASNNGATVSGGYNHTASGQYSIVSGGFGNNASSNYSTISGGQGNTASTNTHATVVGGQSNTASGIASLAGGYGATASGNYSIALGSSLAKVSTASGLESIALGRGAIASGARSIAILTEFGGVSGNNSFAFGLNSDSKGNNSVAIGYYASTTSTSLASFSSGTGKSYLFAQKAHGNGWFTDTGNAYFGSRQISEVISWVESSLITGATSSLSLDGSGTTNLIIPDGNNRAWNVQIDTIAVVTAITGTATGVSVGDCYMEKACLLFKRIGGTSSIVGSPDITSIKYDTSMATCAIDINSGASQQLEIVFNAPAFSGGGSVTFRIVSKVSLVEVAY